MVKEVIGYTGKITHDLSKPDGTPIKRMDVSVMASLGWKAVIPIRDGIMMTYADFLERLENGTLRI